MSKVYSQFHPNRTPQTERADARQTRNEAGGYTFEIDGWGLLDRFLILGTEGGTYYTDVVKMTRDNARNVMKLLREDGKRVIGRTVEISEAGRAVKNSPAIFTLALATVTGDKRVRKMAFDALPRVARTASHLMEFVSYMDAFRGWGRLARDGVARWYTEKDIDQLAYQMVKYRNRYGWAHADILRMAHPKPSSVEMDALFRWATRGEVSENVPTLVEGIVHANAAQTEKEIISIISDYNLTWEMVPSRWLKAPAVWEALMPGLPMTALIRNLGRLTAIGLLQPGSDWARVAVERITNREYLRRARVHPMSLFVAERTYARGQGMRGSLKWMPVPAIVDALDDAFYAAFDNLEQDPRPVLVAVDSSGSMHWGDVSGAPVQTVEAAVAMAMVMLHKYPNAFVIAYDTKVYNLPISKRQRLDDAIKLLPEIPGGTDNAQPVMYALNNRIHVDAFILFTDDQTWAGDRHPHQALADYRRRVNPHARFIDVNMTSNNRTVKEPDDKKSLTIVGFDTALADVIDAFLNLEA